MEAKRELLLHLRKLGIEDADQLLSAGSTELDRYGLAEVLCVAVEQVVQVVNQADLGRIQGMDDESIELLASAGVTSLQELARCKPDRLIARLAMSSGAGENRSSASSPDVIRCWVEEAARLPRRVWGEL